MSLADEIAARRQYIRSDGYTMSIGEFTNLYRDREIIIRPEYQRLFRWSAEKKSRLIESLLLDIPLPSIFVAAQDDGVWEVVDGLQRLSTIFEFMGLLRDEATGKVLPPSSLLATKYLPSLEGCFYENPDDQDNSLDVAQRLALKRAKLDVKILLRDTDPTFKFELFDRLNSGGQPTSEQEVRTAQLLMSHADFFRWLDGNRNSEAFKDSLPLTSRQIAEQYDLELVIRFLVLLYSRPSALTGFAEFDALLTDQSVAMASEDRSTILDSYSIAAASDLFRRTFAVIASIGIDAFRRYDVRRDRFSGGFSVSTFEALSIGVARNIDAWESEQDAPSKLIDKCKLLAADQRFRDRSGAGVRASQRIPVMVEIGPEIFRP
ncbi:DUF262 domain-containing protein [Isoptericola sp. NPDC055881]